MAITFESCLPVTKAFNETNDCTVKAVAIAGDMPYIKAHQILAECGRKHRKGHTYTKYVPALKDAGYNVKQLHDTGAKTVSTLHKYLEPNKRYLVRVRGHVLAYVNGSVEDWTEGRRHRVLMVWEVTATISKNAKRKAARYSAA